MTIKRKLEYLQRRYSNADIADFIGVNQRQIGLYKNGKRNPRPIIRARIDGLIELSKNRNIRPAKIKKKRAKAFNKAIGGILFLPPKKRRIRKSRKSYKHIREDATVYSLIIDDDLDDRKIRKLLQRGLKENPKARIGYFTTYFENTGPISTNISDISVLKEMTLSDILNIEEKYKDDEIERGGIQRIELYLFDNHERKQE